MQARQAWQDNQIDLFKKNLPNKAYSCDQFAVDNKVRSLCEAIERRYIQPNNFNSQSWLVYDIDRPTSPCEVRNDRLAPEPTIFVSNPENRHAHLFYLLDTPVHKNDYSSQNAVRFAAAVDIGLAYKLGADMNYAGLLAKNAAHPAWEIQHTVPTAYSLHDLAESVDTNIISPRAHIMPAYGLGRNCNLFERSRRWSYKAIRQGWPDYQRWEIAVLARVSALNATFSKSGVERLPQQEIEHIAHSVAKWTHQNLTDEGFRGWQAEQGRKGGKAKGKAYNNRREQAIELSSCGLNQSTIAEEIGVSQMTVSRWLKSYGK